MLPSVDGMRDICPPSCHPVGGPSNFDSLGLDCCIDEARTRPRLVVVFAVRRNDAKLSRPDPFSVIDDDIYWNGLDYVAAAETAVELPCSACEAERCRPRSYRRAGGSGCAQGEGMEWDPQCMGERRDLRRSGQRITRMAVRRAASRQSRPAPIPHMGVLSPVAAALAQRPAELSRRHPCAGRIDHRLVSASARRPAKRGLGETSLVVSRDADPVRSPAGELQRSVHAPLEPRFPASRAGSWALGCSAIKGDGRQSIFYCGYQPLATLMTRGALSSGSRRHGLLGARPHDRRVGAFAG